ncbi:MAG: DUF3347 domain-containing protein [Thermoanaerobaculia bacterium]|nr:DUF3347 domain-containing protein [Thermoanaerobaculia bacterium]
MSILKTLIPALLFLAGSAIYAEDAAPRPDALFAVYDEIHDALATDRVAGVGEAGSRLVTLAEAAAGARDGAAAEVARAAKKLTGSELEPLRKSFAELSRAMARLATAAGYEGAQLYHCPMVGAYWLQPKTDAAAANPYYGTAMSKCGTRADGID